jgi:aminopeptidase
MRDHMPDAALPPERLLSVYAEVTVKIGLNLQPGQRLLILGPLANGGTALEAAPLVRHVARAAYAAGAPLVEVLWGDEALQSIRFKSAPRDSFGQFSSWLPGALVQHADAGHAVLSIYANDPDQLAEEPADLVSALQLTTARSVRPFRERIGRNQTNWCVIGAAAPAWAARVFPAVAPERRLDCLWDAIARLCRLEQPDPVAAWEAHLAELHRRTELLNSKRYRMLRYAAPHTSLTIGLPDDHLWIGGRSMNAAGIRFAPNLPTEEVFTMPHKDRVDGTVRATKPLSYGGTMIEGFTLRFEHGRIVAVHAEKGEAVLRTLVDTDAGSARLGEIALVPESSPIAQTRVLFYNTLYDENAASHLAIGAAYKFTMRGGEATSDEAFEQAGGNRSATHVDFMIGSAELDIDGVLADGTVEAVMRSGEWASAFTPR